MTCLISVNLAAINTSNRDDCDLSIDGKTSKYLMLTKTSKTHKINVVGQGSCKLKFLVVGGGGHENGSNAGAGSGFLNYSEVTVEHGTKLITKAGEQRYPSVLQIGTVMWLGRPGNDAPTDQTPGGKGFSGGGMAGGTGGGRLAAGFAGGTNGGDGEGEQGGEGSKFDLSTVKFKAWQITPAAGGQPENSNGQPRIGSIIICQL